MVKPILSLFVALLVRCGAAEAATATVDFDKEVAPILRTRCLGCHGPALQQGGLRLDSGESARKGGKSGGVIAPGNSAASRLIALVSGEDAKRVMPPAGARLNAAEVAVLRNWVDQGAKWPDGVNLSSPARVHWSFQPIRRRALPPVGNTAWVKNDIDRLVLAKLEAENIAPSPEAPGSALIRRVSLDLTGLPPTPAEVDRFLQDTRPAAYERLVDRLLESRHFGEKWALHWLDQARYADSDGYEKDSRRPYAWRWRDWVVDAFNRDMPFDRFTIEQIAGDLLPDANIEQRIATGFHRNTTTNREGGVNLEMFRYEQVVDRASTVGSVWLGLTVGCAQCHDHKYDPISQQDFYRLFAFFNNADELDVEAPLPGELGPHLATRDEYYKQRNKLLTEYKALELRPDWEKRALMAADEPGKWTDWDVVFDTIQKMVDDGERILRTPVEKRSRREEDALLDHMVRWYSQAVDNARYKELKFKELEEKLTTLRKSFTELSQAPVVAERRAQKRTSHVHLRGSWKDKGAEVQPGIPAVFGLQQASSNRLTLARWLVSGDNPLTARVTMNRLWQEMFGRGLVDTPADFGTQGARPSHPELLDWLAAEFQQGWSVKQALRRIALSATYRQSSAARPELLTRDPNNSLLARQNANRLPAELIRDQALAVSGLLNPVVGGRSVEPHMPASMMALAFGGGSWVTWNESAGVDKYRRGMYIHRQRSMLYPLLVNFDAPNMTVTACKRERSNTPLQALNLLNDPVFLEMARGLAHRVLTGGGAVSDSGRLRHAFHLVLARPPSDYESDKLLGFHREQLRRYDADMKAAAALFPYEPRDFSRAEGAAWVALSRVLLNLDEFLTRE